jgi:hypothetical protein
MSDFYVYKTAVNKELIEDLAQIVIDYENSVSKDDSEFRRVVIDRIYEHDDPQDIVNG